MKKIIILIIGILLLCGCETTQQKIEKDIEIYIDKGTCVEYFINYTYMGYTVITPKYDKNGNIKINKQCLEEQK